MSDYLWDRTGRVPIARSSSLEQPARSTRLCRRKFADGCPASRAIAACGLLVRSPPGCSPASTPAVQRHLLGTVASTGRHLRAGESLSCPGSALEIDRRRRRPHRTPRRFRAARPGIRPIPPAARTPPGATSTRFIWAPPSEFVVDTPSARAVDLGCQYDLTVDARGDGYLSVQTGWVAFQAGAVTNPSSPPEPPVAPPAPARSRNPVLRGRHGPNFAPPSSATSTTAGLFPRSPRCWNPRAAKTASRSGISSTAQNTPDRAAVYDRLAALYPLPPNRIQAPSPTTPPPSTPAGTP